MRVLYEFTQLEMFGCEMCQLYIDSGTCKNGEKSEEGWKDSVGGVAPMF